MENFPCVSSNIPHVQWTSFKRGMITKILSNSSKEKDSKATGKGGGIRSSHYLTALIQIYFCLEEQLPKGNITIKNKADIVDLGNVRSIIYPTIGQPAYRYPYAPLTRSNHSPEKKICISDERTVEDSQLLKIHQRKKGKENLWLRWEAQKSAIPNKINHL